MSVEFVRSCYDSEWFLFRDSPDIPTPGGYYFSVPDCPAYPGFHFFGSRNWNPQSHPIAQGLGESITAKQTWDDGDEPAWPVRLTAVGDPANIAAGDLVANAVNLLDTFDGIIPACILPQNPDLVSWSKISDYENCIVQRVFAFIIIAMYNDDGPAIHRVVLDWLGPGPVVLFHPAAGALPGVTTVTTATWQVAIMDGTRNAQQLALQSFTSINGPHDVGGFSTNAFWFLASSYVMAIMGGDGQIAGQRTMLAGHSYGGAVAQIVAARNRQNNATKQIVYLVYGVPKIGDQRAVDLVRRCVGLSIINEGDPIPVLPPDAYLLAPIVGLFPFLAFGNWESWLRVNPQATLRADGSLDYDVPELLDTTTLLRFVTLIVAGQAELPVGPHSLINYLTRLQVRCPECGFPCEEPVCQEIELQNPVIALTTAARPTGGIVFGPGVSLIPGNTCETALAMRLNVPYEGPYAYFVSDFFYLDVVAGVEYSITIETISGGGNSALFFRGGGCPVSDFFLSVGPFHPCSSFTSLINNRIYMVASPTPMTSGVYRLTCKIGSC